MNSLFFPTTVVDGFLDNPNALRNFALEQDYFFDDTGRWPGQRTKPLHQISETIFSSFINRALSLFYNKDTVYTYEATTTFQIVDSKYSKGWVHSDDGIITMLLYLTPDSDSGTSLYTKKDISFDDNCFNTSKQASYITDIKSTDEMIKNNDAFIETVIIKGIYNRLVIFDSRKYHAAHDFFGDSKDNSRLTMVTFLTKLSSEESYPIIRSKTTDCKTQL